MPFLHFKFIILHFAVSVLFTFHSTRVVAHNQPLTLYFFKNESEIAADITFFRARQMPFTQ